MITTACHFPELADADGGIVVEPDDRRRDAAGFATCSNGRPRSDDGWARTGGGWSSAITPGTSRPSGWPPSTAGWPEEDRLPSAVISVNNGRRC